MGEYELKDKGINKDSETTSAVSTISYEIENALQHGVEKNAIAIQIRKLQKGNKFPSNLEMVDAFYDEKTSSSGVAFLDQTTGEVIVGFAGTNLDNGTGETLKDVGQWGNIATTWNSPTSSYFDASNKFMNDLDTQGYAVSTVTGHSLGGRNGGIMGMAHSVPNIILYNAAPFSHSLLRMPTPTNLANANELKNMMELYEGNLIYFVSELDPLNLIAGIGRMSTYPGEIYVMKNGKGHAVTGFLTKKEQAFIIEHTPDLNKIIIAMENIHDKTSKALNDLVNLRLKLSSGGLSSAAEIYLDASEALILTQGMNDTLQVEIDDIKKMYTEAEEDADKLWADTLEMGTSVGSSLHQGEVLGSLEDGGSTESFVRIEPKQIYKQKMSELTAVQQKYVDLIGKIKITIANQVEHDQELARLMRNS